jgi:hypothetical protein
MASRKPSANHGYPRLAIPATGIDQQRGDGVIKTIALVAFPHLNAETDCEFRVRRTDGLSSEGCRFAANRFVFTPIRSKTLLLYPELGEWS